MLAPSFQSQMPLAKFESQYAQVAHVELLQAQLARLEGGTQAATVFVEERRTLLMDNIPVNAWYKGKLQLSGTSEGWRIAACQLEPEDIISGYGGHQPWRSDPNLVAASVEANSKACLPDPPKITSAVAQIEVCGRDHYVVTLVKLYDGTWEIIDSRASGPIRRIRFGEPIAARLVHDVRPTYPEEAKSQHITGVVKFEAIIGTTGELTDIVLLSGPPLLVVAALDAIRQWRYTPTLLNGEPVEVRTEIDVPFTPNQ